MKSVTCPKCGRRAYGGLKVDREKRIASPPWTKTYHYREYLHYAGSKNTITLRRLETILRGLGAQGGDVEVILQLAKEAAGSKVVHHYDPIEE